MTTKETKDNPQIFTTWSDEIKGRIDPYFYNPFFINVINSIEKLKREITALDSVVEIFSGARPKGGVGNILEGIPSLGGEHILSTGEVKTDGLKFIPQKFHKSHLNNSVKAEDIILVKDGATTGKVGIVPKNYPYKDCNINEHVFAIRIRDKKKVVPEYIFSFLFSDLGQSQIKREITGATVTGLTRESVKNLKIPLPPLLTQNKIVAIMQKAYEEKRQKEQEAQKLLDSIDDYVLNELGIKMPEVKDEMIFVVGSDEIEDKRIDPKAYLEKPKAILKSIRRSKYKTKELSKIVIESIAGEWGSDPLSTENMGGYVLCNVLRNTNFDNQFNLNFDNVAQRLIAKTKFNKIRLKLGDILIEKSGGSPIQPVGRVALIEEGNQKYAFSNFLQCFRINQEECLPEYLFAYLKAIYGLGYMEYVQNQTTGIKNLIMEEYLSIPIPLPLISVQNKIAGEARFRREEAKKLQQEAKELLEEAKQKVEELIED